MLDLMPDAMLIADREGLIRHTNHRLTELFGYATGSLIGSELEVLLPVDDHAAHREHRRAFWQKPVTRPMGEGRRLIARRADGTHLNVDVCLSPIGSDAILCAIRDMSARVDFERRLAEAERLAALGTLDAALAHEINNPLQFITCTLPPMRDDIERIASVAADHDVDLEDLRARFASLELAVRRIAETVRAVRSIAHPGSPEPLPVELEEVVEEVLILGRPLWNRRCLIDYVSTPSHTQVLGQRAQLARAMLNVVTNAVDAACAAEAIGAGPARVQIQIQAGPDTITVAVSDNGLGIPESLRARVFEPFYTTKGPQEGTGLGLSQARSIIVDAHGGQMYLEDNAPRGTRCVMSLPTIKSSAVA